MRRPLSDLDYALLGLLAREPASGYELRKVFQTTLLGSYSDSPGSIYPALRRLVTAGHVRRAPPSDGRQRQQLTLTAQGRREIRRWLAQPITEQMVARDAGLVELRLAFLSDVLPAHLQPALREFQAALLARIMAARKARLSLGDDLSTSAALALDLGIHVLRAKASWCARQLAPRRSR